MGDRLLVVNAGSSSLKFALYRAEAEPRLLQRGQIAGIGTAPTLEIAEGSPWSLTSAPAIASHQDAIDWLIGRLEEEGAADQLIGVGHRVVHGGTRFSAPIRLGRAEIAALEDLVALAPHHQPHNLAAIRAIAARRPGLPQIACFDTGFHATQPKLAQRLPLPRPYWEEGLRRFGFHGLSYESIVHQLRARRALPERLIVAHLGNGASLCAIRDGRSIATTMGFSTLDGLIMGTRCGSLDPGAILHLLRNGMALPELEDLLYNRSGLLGLSGISSDMRALLDSPAPAAAAAVDQYCYAILRHLGSLSAALEGVDAVVFTGGIGQNAAPIRQKVCAGLGWLGAVLDPAANESQGPLLSAEASRMAIWALPTQEELVIARHTFALVAASAATP